MSAGASSSPAEAPTWPLAPFRPFDIRMTKLRGHLDRPTAVTPLRLAAHGPSVTYSPLYPQSDGGAVVLFETDYKVTVIDTRDVRACEIEIAYAVPCETSAEISREEIKEYASLELLLFMHDRLRMDLHWLTGSMGLPPLLLEMPHELLERRAEAAGTIPNHEQKG